MTDLQSLQQLRERVSKLEGADAEVDAMIRVIVDERRQLVESIYLPSSTRCWLSKNPDPPGSEYVVWAEKIGGARFKTPAFTASIDAALALVERVLPGHRPGVWRTHAGWDAEVAFPEPRKRIVSGVLTMEHSVMNGESHRPTGALAILLALLDALISEKAKAEEATTDTSTVTIDRDGSVVSGPHKVMGEPA